MLVYEAGDSRPIVLDTKWKVPPNGRPADADLRQVFAYLHTFEGKSGALLYPRARPEQLSMTGAFVPGNWPGHVIFLDLFPGGHPDFVAFRAALPSALGLSAERTEQAEFIRGLAQNTSA